MKRLEFHISYICTHKCIFCSEYDRMTDFQKYPITLYEIKIILIDRKKKGFNHINFTWWEPTLIPWFLELLIFAKKLGYRIYVWTNGTMLNGNNFSEKALQYIDELSLSVHWHSLYSCEKQTWLKYHFNNFPKIVKNIIKYKQNNFFFLNIVINKYNFQAVIAIINFVINTWYPFQQVLISNIAPEWLARHNFWDLVFDLTLFQKDISKIVDFCNFHGKVLRFFWIPLCILWEKYSDYSNDIHWESRHTIERYKSKNGVIWLQDIYSFDNSRERTFVDKCNACKWKNAPCTGIFKRYLEYYNF